MYKKKIREIVIGSNNKGKIKEIKEEEIIEEDYREEAVEEVQEQTEEGEDDTTKQ